MKVVKMLMVAFDLTNNEQLEMLAEMQEFESKARENSMLIDSAFQGSDVAPTVKVTVETTPEAQKAAPARRASATKKTEEVKAEEPKEQEAPAVEEPKAEEPAQEQTADGVVTFNQGVTIEQIKTQISKIATDYGHPEREERVKAAKALMAKFSTKEGAPVSKSTELQESDYPAFYTELVKV